MAAEKGNQYAREWTIENALPRFEDALQFAEENETCLCLQDAIYHSGIAYSTFDQLAVDQQVLGIIKKNIKAAIIRRINRNALDKMTAAPSAASIWRMKQLGEKDEQHVVNSGSTTQKIIVSDTKTVEQIEEMKKRFENE
jgi:hypothetical protein